jgi:glycosyltransferase involved in cell wall biosynthesis
MCKVKNISIIISSYNTQDYIEECLDSVKSQTWFNNNGYEIIVGIDGCKSTLNKLNNIKDKYDNIKIYWFEENVGTYVAFNSLIKKAKYDIISIFGSDDVMKSTFIETNLKEMRDGVYVKAKGVNFSKNINEEIGNKGTNYCGITIFNKYDFFKINGYADWRCGADTDLNRRFLLSGVNEVKSSSITYYRRIHNESLTSCKVYGRNSEYRKKIRNEIKKRSSIKKIINDSYVISEKETLIYDGNEK